MLPEPVLPEVTRGESAHGEHGAGIDTSECDSPERPVIVRTGNPGARRSAQRWAPQAHAPEHRAGVQRGTANPALRSFTEPFSIHGNALPGRAVPTDSKSVSLRAERGRNPLPGLSVHPPLKHDRRPL